MEDYKKIFEKMKINPDDIMSREEYVSGINLMMEIKNYIIDMKSSYDKSQIEVALSGTMSEEDILKNIQDIDDICQLANAQIDESRELIATYNGYLASMKILEKRPSSCSIDDCEFIKNALELQKANPEKQIAFHTDRISRNMDTIRKENKNRDNYNSILQIMRIKSNILRMVTNNSDKLNKLPYGEIFTDFDNLKYRMLNDDNFSEISELYKYINYANMIDLYKNDKETLNKFLVEKRIHDSKHQLIDSITEDIRLFTKRLNTILDDIETENGIIEQSLDNLKDKYRESSDLEKSYSTKKKGEEAISKKKEIESKIKVVSSNISTIEKCVSSISELNGKLASINSMIQPLSDQVEQYKYSLVKLDEYKKELQTYSGKYQYSEILKDGASPGKGIQTLFMEMYLGRTLRFANEILSLFFDESLELQRYIINENEFRIPCLNKTSNQMIMDVKFASDGQKSILGIAISFGLMKEASTKYNIIKLDELDGALDQDNRAIYLSAVEYIKDLLELDHCILVSHSIMELNLSNVDVIYLNSDINKANVNGNIIFTY